MSLSHISRHISDNISYEDYDEVDRLDVRPLQPRRGWSDAAKARREGLAPSQLYTWRRQAFDNGTVRRLGEEDGMHGGDMSFARVNQTPVAGADLPYIMITVNDATVHVRSDIGSEFLARVMRVVRG